MALGFAGSVLLAIPLFVACAAAPHPRGQSSAPTVVTFVVRDPDARRSISSAEVRLISELGDTLTGPTDASGVATFVGLRPGVYRLRVRSIGYPPFDQPIALPTSCDRRVDINLRYDRCDLCEVGYTPPASSVDVQACRLNSRDDG